MKKLLLFLSCLSITFLISCSGDDELEVTEITAQDFSVTIEENPNTGQVLGTIDAAVTSGDLTFAIKSQTPAGSMAIDASSGKLTVADSALFDFKMNPTLTAVIEVSADDTDSKEANVIITLTEEPRPFITTWMTTTANESITIYVNPNVTGYDYQVDWGDGIQDISLTSDATHQYAVAGTYTVKIKGRFPAILSSIDVENAAKLQSIDSWGTTEWKSMQHAFAHCSNMVYNATDVPDLSQVVFMSFMFYNATSFNGDINDWDVSNVTDMRSMFTWATSFNQAIGSWNVRNVIDMSFMFNAAKAFNQDIGIWNVSNVTDMSAMFSLALSFNKTINNWDVSNVTDMSFMFNAATVFNQDISSWNVSKVTNMPNMFSNAKSFNHDISSWNVSNVTYMASMFRGTDSFNQDLSIWNVSNVTRMDKIFSGAVAFNNDIGSWDVSNVTNMAFMFQNAFAFSQDLSGWATDNVNVCDAFALDSGLTPEQLPTAGPCFN